MEPLTGSLLVATNQMPDPRFAEQVIYICSHDDDGAMGLVINKPSGHYLNEVFETTQISYQKKAYPPIYIGGPVDPESAFFLHTPLEDSPPTSQPISASIFLSRDPELLKRIGSGQGPEFFLFCVGYAGWGPGQLEKELTFNGWLSLPASDDILFHVPDHLKWNKAAEHIGIDISLYSDEIGTA